MAPPTAAPRVKSPPPWGILAPGASCAPRSVSAAGRKIAARNFLGVVLPCWDWPPSIHSCCLCFPWRFSSDWRSLVWHVVGGAFLLFNLLWGGVMGNTGMQLLVALGLISGAIGGGALLLLLMDIIAKLLIRYARLHFRLFDTANKSI